MQISIIIPTYKESSRLPRTLKAIYPVLSLHFNEFEIIVVDDLSPDGTGKIVQEMQEQMPCLQLITQPKRLGKGAAIRRGCLMAKGDLVLFMDADHATPINELFQFVRVQKEQQCDVVVGVRTYQENESKWRRILGMIAQIMAHLLVFERAVFDSQCGFKMFTLAACKRIFPLCRVNTGMIDVEIFHIMHFRNIKCVYQPVHWVNDVNSRINILQCMVKDTIDLFRIRRRRLFGVYSKPIADADQPWSGTS